MARASGVGAVTSAGHCIKGAVLHDLRQAGQVGVHNLHRCTFCTRLVSILVPAGECTLAVAPLAGVKVCTAMGAGCVIGVLHRRSSFVFAYSVNFR